MRSREELEEEWLFPYQVTGYLKKKCLIQSDFLNSQTMNNSSEKGISLKLA